MEDPSTDESRTGGKVRIFGRKRMDQDFDEPLEDSPSLAESETVEEEIIEIVEPEVVPLPDPLQSEPTDDILHLLKDKVDEFALLGYGTVTREDLWHYLKTMKKRRPQNLHDLVNTILCLQPQTFMNFTMQQVYMQANHPMDPDEWKDLLAH